MYYKLAEINDISFSLCRKLFTIEEQLLQIFSSIIAFFSKSHSVRTQSNECPVQHLQYDVLYLEGELDMNNSIVVKQQMLKTILNKQSILLDITKLNFIDSSGIATLIEVLHRANTSELKFVIVGANSLPLKMLELSQLDKVFKLFNSIHDVKI
jgi:anti-sigma B factor antagonist